MVRIVLVRHGNTDWNIEKRAQGHEANPLNEVGKLQAQKVGQRLASEKWDAIYSSDLLRARQTAEIIADGLDIPIFFDQRLREQNRGKIQGTIEEERIATWGENWRDLKFWEESDRSLGLRGQHFITEMLERYPGQNILVVSHGKLMFETIKVMFPLNEELSPLENTSVTIIEMDKNTGYTLKLFNCTKHLTEKVLTNNGGKK